MSIITILKLSTVGNPANAIFLMVFFGMEILLENLKAVISPLNCTEFILEITDLSARVMM